MSNLSAENQEPVKIAFASKYTGGNQLGFETLPRPVMLSESNCDLIMAAGRRAATVLLKTNILFSEILRGRHKELTWVEDLFFASISPEHRGLARELAVATAGLVPKNFRLDLFADGTIAEIQCPGSGWGFIAGLEDHYNLGSSTAVNSFSQWLGERTGVWWLYNEQMENSITHLANKLAMNGVNLLVQKTPDFDPNSEEWSVVVKRPPLPQLLESEKGRTLLYRWLDGEIDMDPIPSMIPETKFAMALLHHPQTKDFFTDDDRALCHPTTLVTSFDHSIGQHRIGDASRLSQSQRPFVLKYGGARAYDRFGGHCVFALNKMKSRPDIAGVVTRAVDEWNEDKEGWVLQPFISHKTTLTELGCGESSEKMYVLWRPGFQVQNNGEVKTAGILVNLRKSWKVHGASDTCFGLGVPRNN